MSDFDTDTKLSTASGFKKESRYFDLDTNTQINISGNK